MKKQLPCLQILSRKGVKKNLKRVLLSDLDVVRAIMECSLNMLSRKIPLDKQQEKGLKRYKWQLNYLTNKKKAIKTKQRKLINQTGSGFLPWLIGPAIGLLTKLFQ